MPLLHEPDRAGPRSLDIPVLAVLGLALLLWAWVCVPVIAGSRTFFIRDVFTTHLPLKAFGAEQLRAGRIPAFNPTWGLGQPFRGNPNALPFYPGNLAYLVLPFWSAFGLHYALHWLIALATMGALARGLGMSRAGALLAAVTYAGSGWMVSALTFYNLLAVAAWWPLVLLGAVKGGRRGIALGGIACGLALLGGEPVAAALGLVPLLVIAISQDGWRRGFLTAVAIGAVGLLIALPQFVALVRILPFTYRGSHGMSTEQATQFTLHPYRLIELLVPFPYGRPTWLGRFGVWAPSIVPVIPLFMSLYFGIVGFGLALAGSQSRKAFTALAGSGLLLAIVAGHGGDLLVRLSLGLFRYPEKFLLWFALSVPLLAGWGLDRVLANGRIWGRLAATAGLLFLALATGLRLLTSTIVGGAVQGLARLPEQERTRAVDLLSTQLSAWTVALLAGGLALAAAAWVVSRKPSWSGAALAALQVLLLAQLAPLLATDSTAPYREPAPWAKLLGPGSAVLDSVLAFPPWAPEPVYRTPDGPRIPLERATALDLDPAPGVLHGLTYPFAPDLEGLQSPLFTLMLYNLPRLNGIQRLNWLRALGLDGLVLFEDVDVPGLRLLDRAERYGVVSRLYRVENPAPEAWWPERVRVAGSPPTALWVVSNTDNPLTDVVVNEGVAHKTRGRVRLLVNEPDHIEMDVESDGGLAVVRRAYQPLFVARSEGKKLRTVPVDLNLLGVEVPPGRHRVVLSVPSWPEWLAAAVALATLIYAVRQAF
ncbi:MAG TPA: hypothetical protein VH394_05510 [Thermoanaerobaculia bacterium]|jgi:hypothetical protein|nr:hypothetical protein [Thermoanaerobaculia bacterium]